MLKIKLKIVSELNFKNRTFNLWLFAYLTFEGKIFLISQI